MGFFDTVKQKASGLASDAERASKVTAAQARLLVLQNDLRKAERELGHEAFTLVERGELTHAHLAAASERVRAVLAEIRAKENEIAVLRGGGADGAGTAQAPAAEAEPAGVDAQATAVAPEPAAAKEAATAVAEPAATAVAAPVKPDVAEPAEAAPDTASSPPVRRRAARRPAAKKPAAKAAAGKAAGGKSSAAKTTRTPKNTRPATPGRAGGEAPATGKAAGKTPKKPGRPAAKRPAGKKKQPGG